MRPAPVELPLPSPPFPRGLRPRLVPGFLSGAECRALIGRAESLGFRSASPDYPPSYRNNDRLALDEPALAAALLERLRPYVAARLSLAGRTWRVSRLNERLRLCRYRPGQRFGIHRDGVHYREGREQSMLTFMVYLNDAAEFAGGSTRFFPERGAPPATAVSLAPAAGSLILFAHELWHDGEEVSGGVKYVLRSDIVYERESPAAEEERHDPRGYLWNVVEAGPGLLVTGSRAPCLRLWTLDPCRAVPLARIEGHSHSVTALLGLSPGVLWSGSRDRTVRIWQLGGGSGGCLRVLRGHEGVVLSLVGTPAGIVASGAADGTIRRWSRDGDPLGALEAGGGWVWALAGLGGSRVASGTEDGAVRVWDIEGGRLQAEAGRGGAPVRALIALGRALVSGHADGIIRIWSERSGSLGLAKELAGHDADVRALAVLPGGRIASGSEDGTIRVWDPRAGLGALGARHEDFVTGLCVLADGRLASSSYDGTLGVWDLAEAARPPAA